MTEMNRKFRSGGKRYQRVLENNQLNIPNHYENSKTSGIYFVRLMFFMP
jgi:hypothetical protein